MLRWSRVIPNGLWSAFKEGPPSIPILLVRNRLLEWACLLRVDRGLKYVLLEMNMRDRQRHHGLTPRKLRKRSSNLLRHSLLGSGEGASMFCVDSENGWMAN